MAKLIDLTNQRFGRLLVLRYTGKYYWLCLCDCGVTKPVHSYSLRNGDTKSCGCLRREVLSNVRHRLAGTPIHQVWVRMKQRCHNPNNKSFKHYGARGIRVCERWTSSFENFLADMGERPSNRHSIDRIDNDGDYTPENCRWATLKQQANNTRRNRKIEHNGVTKNLNQWASELGMSRATLESRIGVGRFPVDQIFNAGRLPKGPPKGTVHRKRNSYGQFI